MLQYRKRSDLQVLLEKITDYRDILAGIFLDNPELEHFEFSVHSEYDDNNYNDVCDIVAVNGHYVDYSGRYQDDEHYQGAGEDAERSDLPRMIHPIVEAVIDFVNDYGKTYGQDDHKITREFALADSKKSSRGSDREGAKYLKSYLSKEKIEDSWFLKADPKWAAYYAEENGRFAKEIETKIFCKKGRMMEAYMYAQALKRPLPEEIETFYTTHNLVDPDEGDNLWFKEYLKFKKNLTKKVAVK